MAEPLPRLRMDLDFMPSPVPDRPGLMIRDPYHYSDTTLIVPPALVECLQFFDGEQTELDLRAALARVTGDVRVGDLEQRLCKALREAGFFDDEVYRQMKDQQQKLFAQAPRREAAHAGSAYSDEPQALRSALARYLNGQAPSAGSLRGIAAPHVTPEGGWKAYGAAYRCLGPQHRDCIFVVLGTSHYGEPEHFGLTRKPFVTPLGETRIEQGIVDRLAREAAPAVKMEDYCHAIEHSIEFQIVFLQHLYGADIRVVPILCGPFARSLYQGGKPEDNDGVRRFFGALAELAVREGKRLFWVLGVDMAHMGRRYGDPFTARAGQGQMAGIAELDRRRISQINRADSQGFWETVQENHDELKWCGSAPIYTFLKAVPVARGDLLEYQQWNIDEHSVVSFAALAFREAD